MGPPTIVMSYKAMAAGSKGLVAITEALAISSEMLMAATRASNSS